MSTRLLTIPQKKKYGIYCLVCPVKNKVVYVGCSENISERYYHHHHLPPYTAISKYLKRNKNKPFKIIILFWTNSLFEASKMEVLFIEKYDKKHPLINLQKRSAYKGRTIGERGVFKDKRQFIINKLSNINPFTQNDEMIKNNIKLLGRIEKILTSAA